VFRLYGQVAGSYRAIMATARRSHPVGPGWGTIVLRTTRQGLAAQVGHDLAIEVARWSGTVVVGGDPADSALDITVETGSLRVLEGTGGVTPLSDRDIREIEANAAKVLGADRAPTARFLSGTVTPENDGGARVAGTLTLRGIDRPLVLRIIPLGGGRFRATGSVLQSDYGIKPYSALLGALRLADAVGVEAELELSGDDLPGVD
jgi:polyisoprenoid-binding protein YceI